MKRHQRCCSFATYCDGCPRWRGRWQRQGGGRLSSPRRGLTVPTLIWGLICVVDVVVKSILHGRAEGFPCHMGCLKIYTGSTFLSRLSLQNRKKKKRQLVFQLNFWALQWLLCVAGENHRYLRGVPRVYMNLSVYVYMCVSMLFTGNATPFWLWWLCFHALILSGNDLITNIIY